MKLFFDVSSIFSNVFDGLNIELLDKVVNDHSAVEIEHACHRLEPFFSLFHKILS